MIVYKEIKADLDEFSYSIIIGRGLLENVTEFIENSTKNKKVLIVSDVFFQNSVSKKIKDTLLKSGYEVFEYYMDAGKGNKNINEVLKIYGILEENNLARDSSLIAIGGGVIGDLAGFVSSTWLRGMNLIHIPTTLMAMVDSSVGGKTAINFRQTINAIGSYYHPIVNIMDMDLIDMLSERDYSSGVAEVIKCAIINDSNLYSYLIENNKEIEHSVDDIKKSVSSLDVEEAAEQMNEEMAAEIYKQMSLLAKKLKNVGFPKSKVVKVKPEPVDERQCDLDDVIDRLDDGPRN